MSKEQIVVTVGVNGEIEISAEGFKGKGCEAATKFIEEALGLGGTRTKKPEWFQQETAKQVQRT